VEQEYLVVNILLMRSIMLQNRNNIFGLTFYLAYFASFQERRGYGIIIVSACMQTH